MPAQRVHEDERVVVIHDIAPQAPVHWLVIPKVHVATVMDLTAMYSDTWWRMLEVTQELARTHGIVEPGFRLVINCNAGAGQSIFHLHMHVLGGRPFSWPPG